MAQPYFSLVTDVGRFKLAASATPGNPKVTISHFAIGDGNGAETNPTGDSTALVREVWRTGVESVVTDPLNPAAILVTAIIPTTAGGWWMREFGIFDDTSAMIAVAKPVSQYKPTALEGQLEDIRYEFQIIIGETAQVTLLVDPSVLMASRIWVKENYFENADIAVAGWLNNPPVAPVDGTTVIVDQQDCLLARRMVLPRSGRGPTRQLLVGGPRPPRHYPMERRGLGGICRDRYGARASRTCDCTGGSRGD